MSDKTEEDIVANGDAESKSLDGNKEEAFAENHADVSNVTQDANDSGSDECHNRGSTSSESSSLHVTGMKKDDSGISVGKSPSKDSSLLSEGSEINQNDSDANISKDSGALGVSNNTSKQGSTSDDPNDVSFISNESELDGHVQDIDTEDSLPTESYNVNATGDNEDEEQEVEVNRRKRRSARPLSSDTNSDAEDNNNTDTSSSDESDVMDKADEWDANQLIISDYSNIATNYQMLYDIRKREYGVDSRFNCKWFQNRMTSNLGLIQRLELQYKMDKHEGCVNALHFNYKGTLLTSGSDDLNIIIWDWSDRRPILTFNSGHRSNVFQSKFLPYSGDSHIVSCARDGQVRLAELSVTNVCKSTKRLAQHRGAAHKLALQHDSPYEFLSCGEDAVIFQLDLRQEKANKIATTIENDRKVSLYSIHSNPSNSYEFCVGGRDAYIRIYDKRKIDDGGEDTVKKFCPHHLVDNDTIKAHVTCAVYNYNGTNVLGTYNDEDIYLFDTSHSTGADYIKRYSGHRNNATVKGVNFYGPHSEYIISGSDCGNIFLWESQSEKIVQYFHGDEGGVINVLEPHPWGPFLATSGLDSDVKIWAPTASSCADLEKLSKVTKKNIKERRQERSNEPEMFDGQMLWLLMHHLQRTRRRAAREAGDVSDNSQASVSDSEDSDPENLPGGEPVSCQTS